MNDRSQDVNWASAMPDTIVTKCATTRTRAGLKLRSILAVWIHANDREKETGKRNRHKYISWIWFVYPNIVENKATAKGTLSPVNELHRRSSRGD
jgi:hypothetical protein